MVGPLKGGLIHGDHVRVLEQTIHVKAISLIKDIVNHQSMHSHLTQRLCPSGYPDMQATGGLEVDLHRLVAKLRQSQYIL